MTGEELLQVIEEARASGATVLDLSFKELTAIPGLNELNKLK